MFSLDTNENVPLHTITEENGLLIVDSSISTLNGEELGATTGVHRYSITRDRLVPDATDNGTPLTIVAGGNVAYTSGSWNKSVNTNGWNASVNSSETFDTAGVFAISWDIEQNVSWTRMMGGLAATIGNDSYKAMSVGLYQLNNYMYNFYYRLGVATHNQDLDYTERTVTPGDRFVLCVSSGQVKFYIRKNGILYYMGMLPNALSGTVQFMAAFNRGKNKTGSTIFKNAYVHTNTSIDTIRYVIEGIADAEVSDEDKESLLDLGFTVTNGSTYGKLQMVRSNSEAYTDNGTPTSCQVVHEYFGNSRQAISTM